MRGFLTSALLDFYSTKYILWDVGAAIIPYVPGSYVAKGIKYVSKVDDVIDATKGISRMDDAVDDIKTFGDLSNASKYGIESYSSLVKKLKDTGLQVHHVVEKRFADIIGVTSSDTMLSIAVTKSEHQLLTNAWRQYIPYGTNYATLSKDYIWSIAEKIYKNYPELLEAAKKTIFK